MKSFKGLLNTIRGDQLPEAQQNQQTEEKPSHTSTLAPNEFRAISRTELPLAITIDSISCYIDYSPEQARYRIKATSGKRMSSEETVNPTDRHRKAVSNFMYKGLIGIHLHPSGIILHLDEEKNFKGEARHNQTHAEITSAKPSKETQKELQGRLTQIDLKACSQSTPLLICPNHGKLHMLVRPDAEKKGRFGVFLSSAKGKERENTPPSFYFEQGKPLILSQDFLIKLATIGKGNIDARNWNAELRDPILARFTLSDSHTLNVEELFTSDGLTFLLGNADPIYLGTPGVRSEKEEAQHQKECLAAAREISLVVSKNLQKKTAKEEKEAARERVMATVLGSLKMDSPEGVRLLALELALKEVLATLYGITGASETAMQIDNERTRLIDAITRETIAKLKSARTRQIALTAVHQAVRKAAPNFPLPQLGKGMVEALPPFDQQAAARLPNDQLIDLAQHAAKTLVSAKNVKNVKQILQEIKDHPDQKAALVRKVHQIGFRSAKKALEYALVRALIMKELPAIEKIKRAVLQDQAPKELVAEELESIQRRYAAYAAYMTASFQKRLKRSMDSTLKEFQYGTTTDTHHRIPTKGFLTYMIALRTAGGQLTEQTDSVPAVSPLQTLPGTVPHIEFLKPDPTATEATVRVSHNDSVLIETTFECGSLENPAPEGVPLPLWQALYGLSSRVVDFYLTGASHRLEDRKQHERLITLLTEELLKKMLNFLRGLQRKPPANNYNDLHPLLRESRMVLITRGGEKPEDEWLDLKKRSDSVRERPLNLKHALKLIVNDLLKKGVLSKDSYRFKPQMHTFATAGTKADEKILLPIEIQVERSQIAINAKFNEEIFKKTIHIPAEK
ncbi:MAG: hypothetical protein HQL52_12415 [Magnetococcales bacterium]|nr:hypothetical protein [Magnetococcales bacterium]